MTKQCHACGTLFEPCSQVQTQQFCSNPECQRERRRHKQQERRAKDPSIKDSNAQYLRDWLAKNPGYWKRYRNEHPEYTDKNRRQQKIRQSAQIAKDAVWTAETLPAGRYRLIRIPDGEIANETMWIVEIVVLSGPHGDIEDDCKEKP